MWHAIELVTVLVLVCAAQAAIDVAPRPARRAILNFLTLCVAFAVGITVLSFTAVADPVVRLGIAVLIAYLLRWMISSVVDYLRGPVLMEPIRAVDLAAAAADDSAEFLAQFVGAIGGGERVVLRDDSPVQ